MSTYDSIDEALNTTSSIEVSTTPEGGSIEKQDALKNVTDLSLIHISEPTRPY